ncbi:M28 family peptidase [Rubricoccus marinus]|uniref:EF-hand domain-containing protein n=1 Tax=Rubricoccus marinus TaxID=716817 RepID=A0A259TZL5_9BACT|nr:M28 family peptidase [Rubricoccus marinus]OZC03199.1 hypothetical protein BSZ36_09565 [Rubricoccus marinus]
MTHRFALAALGLALLAPEAIAQTPDAAEDPALVQRYQATITPAELAGHLYVYADDYMAGRDTGEPGQRFAATYLAGQYATMGVTPMGTAEATNYGVDGYRQPFMLDNKRMVSMNYSVTRGGAEIMTGAIPLAGDAMLNLIPFRGEITDASPAPLVWAGDGSDVDDLDVRDAYVMFAVTDQASMMPTAQKFMDMGARAVVLPASPTVDRFQRMASGLTRGRLALPSPEASGDDPVILLTGLDVASMMVGKEGMTAEDFTAMEAGPTGAMISVSIEYENNQVETENVVAMVEGSDPLLKDEFVIISAHLDHVGTRDVEEGEDGIFNGADDDGSGTISILEIAEAFQTAAADGNGPRRSILFLHVTGEEKGLLGSAYFADMEPLVPLEQTVANLNIDMIGRYDPERRFDTTDYVYIIGGDLISQDISDWNETVNDVTGTELLLSDRFNSPDDPNQFFRRSDHWNFGKHDIPFIFYFTGTHEDYHAVGDSPDKIDYDRMAKISRLVFGTAWHIANTDERPAVSGVGFN